MKLKLFLAALAAGLVASALGGSAVYAAHEHPGQKAKHRQHGVPFVFRGRLLAAPAAGATSLSVHVTGGNKRALRALLGHSQNQTFTVGSKTVYIRWQNGVPTVIQQSQLAAGDMLTIRIRAPRRSTLAQLTATEARLVADRGPNPARPSKPLFLFRGTLTAVGQSSLTVHVKGGNKRALRRLLGQSVDRTFRYDENTVFLVWQGRTPTVVSPSQLKIGAKVVVRIRAARGSTLSQIESTPASHVAQHERPAKR